MSVADISKREKAKTLQIPPYCSIRLSSKTMHPHRSAALYFCRMNPQIFFRAGIRTLYNLIPTGIRRMLFRGNTRFCPLCNSTVRRFYPAGLDQRPDARCPVCNSLERHRLFCILTGKHTSLFDGSEKRLLHIAPEESIEKLLRRLPNVHYLSADLEDTNAMVKMDITDIQYPVESFDVILCSHVLEHVPDDRRALREFYRVLTPDGWCGIQIPVTDAVTFEDPSVTDPEERLRIFGQRDHVRRYGPDVRERMEEAGFAVQELTTETVASEEEIVRMGLMRNDRLYLCRKGRA